MAALLSRCRILSDLIDDVEKKQATRNETGNTEKKPVDRRGNGRRKTPFGLIMAALLSRCRILSDLIDDVEKKPADRRGNGRRKTPFGLIMAALWSRCRNQIPTKLTKETPTPSWHIKRKQQRQGFVRETDVLEGCAILENIDALERCAIIENIDALERCASLEALDVLDERMLYLLYFRFHQNKGAPLSARPCPVI